MDPMLAEVEAIAVKSFHAGSERMRRHVQSLALLNAEQPGVAAASGRDALVAFAAFLERVELSVTAEAARVQ